MAALGVLGAAADTFAGPRSTPSSASSRATRGGPPPPWGSAAAISDAVRLALLGLDIGPGDEVIVPGHTAIATWLAVSAHRRPRRPRRRGRDHDADKRAGDAVRAALTARTAAIVVVHLYGLVAPIAAIARLARDRGLALVEDASQAHGARPTATRRSGRSATRARSASTRRRTSARRGTVASW